MRTETLMSMEPRLPADLFIDDAAEEERKPDRVLARMLAAKGERSQRT